MMGEYKFHIGDTVRIINMRAAKEYWGFDPTYRSTREFTITQRTQHPIDGNLYSREGYGLIQEKNLELVEEEKNVEKQFKVGDWVKVNKDYESYAGAHKEYFGKVFKIEEFRPNMVVFDADCYSCRAFDHWIPKQFLDPVPQKILIMQDEKEPNRVFARNVLTGEQAEAKCAPGDDFDFNKGAALAFERLTKQKKPEKSKDERPLLNGKFICIAYNDDPRYFTVGKVYTVKDGIITSNTGDPNGYNRCHPVHNLDELNNMNAAYNLLSFHHSVTLKFIEYKGEN